MTINPEHIADDQNDERLVTIAIEIVLHDPTPDQLGNVNNPIVELSDYVRRFVLPYCNSGTKSRFTCNVHDSTLRKTTIEERSAF